ncbi:MAG: sulfite exporter TauE/SafE family protein [Promethearchaeota archaeon]|nr:MAG: sulfite exporter TauE/SafE family protein [Candidatus Lokiarchaeota archaeon]
MFSMNELEIILLFIIFLMISILGNLSGTGGGLLKVPVLIFFGYLTDSVVISLLIIPFLSIPTTIINIRRKIIDYKASIFIIGGAFLGTILGITVYNFLMAIDQIYYISVFSVFLILASFRFLFTKNNSKNNTIEELAHIESIDINYKTIIITILIGILAGISSPLFGVGGGLVVTPLLVLIFHFKVHRSIAASIFIMNFTTAFSIFQHFMSGYISSDAIDTFIMVLILGIGTVLGSVITSYIFKKTKQRILKYIFVIIVLTIAVPLLWLRYIFPIY